MSQTCSWEDGKGTSVVNSIAKMCFIHLQQFKTFCKENNMCVRCTSENRSKPVILSSDGLLCPICDQDEYNIIYMRKTS
jgi:hypothetical protein